jgi:hypothetical protein
MVEHWNVVDMFGFYEQVGLIPQPAAARTRTS